MHEISLVRNIFRTLEDQVEPAEMSRLKTIRLRIGLLSNVEPVLLRNALEAVTETEQPQHRAVQLAIELVPVKIYCENCQAESVIEQYKFRCNVCGAPNNNLVSGTELLISGLEFED